jgi:sugar (pentulose or hexulose) kinase
MLDLSTRDWNAAVVEAAGLAGVPRSRLLPDDAAGGEFVCAGRRLPCFPAVGDQQAALLGVQLNVGELSINSSTGSQVGVLTEQLELGDYQTRPFFKGKWLNTLTHLPAGRSLNVLVELLSALAVAQGRPLEDPWSHIARSAESAQDSELVVDLSFFAGPLGDHGAIRGITTENLTVGGLFRAAFRNMAENYECCARRLRPLADWPAVVLSGGLPQKIPILRELIAQRYTAPVRLSEATEETLLGLQVLARRIFAAEASTASAGS